MSVCTDELLSVCQTAAFHADVLEYLHRTSTSHSQLSRWAAGYDSAVSCMLRRKQVQIDTAARYRTAMAEHPEGRARRIKGTGKHMANEAIRVAQHDDEKSEIAQRRISDQQRRTAHYIECRAEHFAKYGTYAGFGKPLEQMAI